MRYPLFCALLLFLKDLSKSCRSPSALVLFPSLSASRPVVAPVVVAVACPRHACETRTLRITLCLHVQFNFLFWPAQLLVLIETQKRPTFYSLAACLVHR